MTARTFGIITLIALALFGIGWLTGASGRSGAVQERQDFEQRAAFAEARAHVLEGRVSLFQINFGAASQQFDRARATIELLQTRLRERGDADRAGKLEIALARIRDAQRLAVAVDASAQNAAEEALRAIDAAR
jgi:hypothetical protein